MNANSTFTLLHLSDLHIRPTGQGEQIAQKEIFTGFWRYIDSWMANVAAPKPDLVVITGDLAARGQETEYGHQATVGGAAQTVYSVLDTLRRKLHLSRTRMCMTPGNHDVDRGCVSPYIAQANQQLWSDPVRLRDFFFDDSYLGAREEVFRRLRNFYDFYCSFLGLDAEDHPDAIMSRLFEPRAFGRRHRLPIGVCVAHICTSWLSQSYYKAIMEQTRLRHDPEPPSFLAVCPPHLSRSLDGTAFDNEDNFRIGIMHHPSEWMASHDRHELEKFLGERFDLILTGHIHKTDVVGPRLGGRAHTIGAGAFYKHPDYQNEFNVIRIGIEDGRPQYAHLMEVEWDSHEKEWRPRTQARPLSPANKAERYANKGVWFQIPLTKDASSITLLTTLVRAVINDPPENADELVRDLRTLLASLSGDHTCSLARKTNGSLLLDYSVDATKVQSLVDKLRDDPHGKWQKVFAAFGVDEVELAGKRYNMRPLADYGAGRDVYLRARCLSPSAIAEGFDVGPGGLFRSFPSAFNEMLKVRGNDDHLIARGLPVHVENLSPDEQDNISSRQLAEDWSWYCVHRIGAKAHLGPVSPEVTLYRYLSENLTVGAKKVILIHGGTGHGKTTFIRHFFRNYIRTADPELASRLRVVRIPLAIAGLSPERIEDDVDNKINTFLDKYYPELYHDDHVKRMGQLALDTDTTAYAQFLRTFPHEGARDEKRKWLCSIMGRPDPSVGPALGDLNRLRLSYMTSVGRLKVVIVLDNLDQATATVQKAAFMIARHKLEWVQSTNDVTFIIAIRTYLLTQAAKELSISAYQKRYEVAIRPCRIGDVVEKRLQYVTRGIQAGEAFLPARRAGFSSVEEAVAALVHWSQVFHLVSVDKLLGELTNYDLREQLRMVEAIFESPSFTWRAVGRAKKRATTEIVSADKLLDMLLRGTNVLCRTDSPPFLNIFNAGDHAHYSNSLNIHYILRILLRNTPEYVDNIVAYLADLGHSPAWTRDSLKALLERNVIQSHEGFRLKEHCIREVYMDPFVTPLGYRYVNWLTFRLYYLQAMAYQTPMRADFITQVALPDVFGKEVATFIKRVSSAAALVKQVAYDEKMQLDLAAKSSAARGVMDRFQLEGFAARLRVEASNQLEDMKVVGAYPTCDWDKLMAMFSSTTQRDA